MNEYITIHKTLFIRILQSKTNNSQHFKSRKYNLTKSIAPAVLLY
jgi:hypothetical protein